MACDAFDAALSWMIPHMRNRMIAILTPAAPCRVPALPRQPFGCLAAPSASTVKQVLTRGAIMLNNLVSKQRLVLILLVAFPALADPPHSRGGLSATFRDWRLDCMDGTCTASTRLAAADGTEVLRLSVAGAEPRVLAVVTPLPLHLPDGLALALGPRPESRAPWRTCGASGCEATLALDADLLEALRRERAGAASFTLVDGVRVRLGVSLLGFSAALDALDAPVSLGP
jgi:invasion protein IalB